MNNNSTIDDIFKDGLSDMNFSNRETLWKKMEDELDNKNRKKKRFAFILLFCCLVTGGFFAAKNINQNTKILPENKLAQQKESNGNLKNINHISAEADNNHPSSNSVKTVVSAGSKPFISKKIITKATKENIAISTSLDIDENTEDVIIAQRVIADFNMLSYSLSYEPSNIIAVSQKEIPVEKPLRKNTVIIQKIVSLEIVAGSDIFNLNKKVGYYGGVRISRNLDKGTSISAGINYSFNTLNEKYRLSNKPLQQQETDAQINSLKMLRFPVFFQRQIPKTKFALMAGLIPSYILDAAVYNVPNSNTGNPALYRKFTLNDIHRFNILFGAGIKYSPVKKISFELSGNYGFTELVKNSYINQSSVNDNFKNIQAGVVFLLK